ncbi:MAG TPA: hypothetical protein VEB60_00260, partial [Candidatus Paceibacterota bacterium]|nr:hypothetical protein [Candidatus Paceibacterota bacterium]
MNTKLQAIILCGLGAVLFVPLIVADGLGSGNSVFGIFNILFPFNLFFPFITGKAFLFRIITEIIFGCWLLLAWRDPSYRPQRTALAIAIGLFVSVIGLADVLGANPGRSFWSNFERMEGYVTLLHLAAYFIVLVSMVKTEKLWNRFLSLLLAVGVVQGAYGLFQIAGLIDIRQGGTRLDGTFGNA